jgi:hypothetical protein
MKRNKALEAASRKRWQFPPILILSCLLTGVFAGPTAASVLFEEAGRFQIHGFLAQTAIYTSDNNFFGDTDDSISFDYRGAGLNGSWLIHPDFLVSGQLLYSKAGNSDADNPLQIDYAFADYSFLSEESYRYSLSLGRVKNPFGLFNETRDVPFTRNGIFLPQSVYPERIRSRMISGDGAYLRGEHASDYGSLRLNAGVYRPRYNDDFTDQVIGGGRNVQGELDANTSYILRLLYELDEGRYRLAFTHAGGDADYDPGNADPIAAGSFDFRPSVWSFEYSGERFGLTSEYALRRAKLKGFGPPRDRDVEGEGYYVEGTYRLTPRWEVMLRYDASFADRNDRDGSEYQARTGRPSYERFSKDWTLGVRWDPTSRLMLRAEFHHVDGVFILPPADNPDRSSATRRWNILAGLISYRF